MTDFGIARAGASEITQTGSVLGTAQYLSPEQAQGLAVTARLRPLLDRGDALRGAHRPGPVRGRDAGRGRAEADLRAATRPPRELNPQVRPRSTRSVLRALAKDPANRFGSADEFSCAALDAAEVDPDHAVLGATAAYAAIAAAPEGTRDADLLRHRPATTIAAG